MPKNAPPSSKAAEVLRRIVLVSGVAALLFTAQLRAEGQYIDLFPKNRSDIQLILNTLDDNIGDNIDIKLEEGSTGLPPIILMLHGDQAHQFLRPNYEDNKTLVDQTARLAEHGIIDVKICETWMRHNNYTNADLFPFVQTVPFGAGELERLAQEENYREFSVPM